MLVVTIPGQNTDDGNVAVRELETQRFHQADDTELRSPCTRPRRRDRAGPRGRRRHHRPALTVRLDARQERVHGVEHAVQVHAHAPIPIVVAGLADAADHGDPGIRDDGVHFAEVLHHIVGRLVERCAVGHVHTHGVDAIARLLELFHRFVEIGFGAIGDRHFHAGVGEGARDAEADAAVAAGDEGDLAFDILHRSRNGGGAVAGGGRIRGDGGYAAHHQGCRGACGCERRAADELAACAARRG